jgi:ABC-type amino acid transport substrate-binding protein/mono/diheme cytochrome c family protein
MDEVSTHHSISIVFSKTIGDFFMSKSFNRALSLRLSLAALAVSALTSPFASADTLRVCSDPDNLPFSKSEGPEKGLYIELAEKVGQRLGSPVEYVWWLSFNQRRALRNTMDGCDAYFALPADAQYRVRGLVKSNAFMSLSYALVGPKGQTYTGLSDLKGKRVGVLFGSPPAILLASSGSGYQATTYRSQEQAFAALDKGEIDMAMLWGPSAGFDNQSLHQNRWQVLPISGEGLSGQVAIAVSKDKPELKDQINKALDELKPEIEQLAKKYGFPSQAPLLLNSANKHISKTPVLAQKSGFVKVAATTEQREWLLADASGPYDTAEVRSNFNNKCSHCHANNGASPVQERDLRKLVIRYNDNWKKVTYDTIVNGRIEYGMPKWGGILPEKEIEDIIRFLDEQVVKK